MNLFHWLQANWLETLGVVTGLMCVALTIRENIWCWPIGIASSLAYFVFFRNIKLYVDQWLQIFFITTSVYGWRWLELPPFSRANNEIWATLNLWDAAIVKISD